MNRYICIHGHFYQPPRENPWIEDVEQQDSAYPYHDWNERVTAECYAPNTASRILDSQERIVDIVNNYSSISFNFGPTLLSWMERRKPEVYAAILEADRASRERFGGHGSALAQVYNHVIMPLANSRDKRTQIIWGLKDFEYRFKRPAEGMWLAETAVDLETLDLMAEYGLRFTILAPHQARCIRKREEKDWIDVSGQNIDPKQPYVCRLPSGRSIAVFFYDGPISMDVSFAGVLKDGEGFAQRLLGAFAGGDSPQLVSIATDGETYGHHHRYGEMALTYCLHSLEMSNSVQLTVFGQYLEKFPPQWEVAIFENTSWSCSHGVERWQSDCGCRIGRARGRNQAWRAPLKEAMDWLRDLLAKLFEREMRRYVDGPWKMRDDFIELVLDRDTDNVEAFLARHTGGEMSRQDKSTVLKFLELQRHAMLMYTSCGWFFDDIAGIEAVQVMSYAANAMHIAKEITGIDVEPEYLNFLKKAPSLSSDYADGGEVYNRCVKPAVADLLRVGAHYALSSLFEDYPRTVSFYCYTATSEVFEVREAGMQRLAMGVSRIRSHITWEETRFSFAILHFGGHNMLGGIYPFAGTRPFETMCSEVEAAFMRSNIAEVIRCIEKHFGKEHYTLWHLFRDKQRDVLNRVLTATIEEQEASFREAYKNYYPVMQAMAEMSMPFPRVFYITVEFTLNTDLRKLLESEEPELEGLKTLIDEVKRWSVNVDVTTLSFVATRKVRMLLENLFDNPQDRQLLDSIRALLEMLQSLDLELNLWEAQNIYFAIGQKMQADMLQDSADEFQIGEQWVKDFSSLGLLLQIKPQL